MSKVVELINLILDFIKDNEFITELIEGMSNLRNPINWNKVLAVNFVLLVALFLAGVMFLVNDFVFEYYMNRRIKTHRLTVTNNGNTSSLFLLRTVDLPKSLAVRFRVDGMPLIRVSYVPKSEKKEEEKPPEAETETGFEEKTVPEDHMQTLIPDLKDPMSKGKKKVSDTAEDAVGTVTKSINEVGKKAGFFASILANVSSLLPGVNGDLRDAQASLKGIQQDASQLTSSIGTKVNTAKSLGDQLGRLPMGDKITAAAESMAPDISKIGDQFTADRSGMISPITEESADSSNTGTGSLRDKNFVYDEEVWNKNIGKVDELGGSLNFFQSKILNPGESMKIDVEIMNLSESAAAVSHLYKIEVLQIPQTRLPLTAPNHYVNGIVIYEKVAQIERILPQMIVVGLVILSLQIVAAISNLVF